MFKGYGEEIFFRRDEGEEKIFLCRNMDKKKISSQEGDEKCLSSLYQELVGDRDGMGIEISCPLLPSTMSSPFKTHRAKTVGVGVLILKLIGSHQFM